MDHQSSSHSHFLPGGNSFPEGVRQRAVGEISSEESQVPEISRASVLRPKTGLDQGESDSRFVIPEQVHQVRQIPDAHYFTGTDPTSPWGRHYLHRSYRRLLAYSDCSSVYPLPWFQTGKAGLFLQSYALRAQHSSQSVHQVGGHCGPGAPPPGNSGSGLPGRLDSLGPLGRGMPKSSQKGSEILGNSGFQNQPQEISPDPELPLRMARPTVGSNFPQTVSSFPEETRHRQVGQVTPPPSFGITKGTGEGARLSTVCLGGRSGVEIQIEGHQQDLDQESELSSKRQEEKDSSNSSVTSSTMVVGDKSPKIGSSSLSTSFSRDPYGRVADWLGRSCSRQVSSGDLVTLSQSPPHQCVGSDGSVPLSQEVETETELPYQTSSGQSSNCSLPEQTGFSIETDQSCNDCNSLSGQEEVVASLSHSSGGSPKCSSGLSLPDLSARVRMVAGHRVIPMGVSSDPKPPGGSVCDGSQSQTSVLRGPQPGPSGFSHGRPVSELGQMGADIPVSSGQLSFEGPAQAKILQRQGGSDCPQLAEEQLVPSPSGAQAAAAPDTQSSVVSGSANQDCIRFILDNEQLDFMGFLKFAAKRRFDIDPANMDFTEADKTESTVRQYDSAFRKLASYIRLHKPSEMSINVALSFFRHLHTSGLAASTVTATKSALSKVFYYGFDMRLNDVCFASIARSCAKLRPASRPEMLSWSLNKVLRLASNIDNSSCSYQQLLRKTLFLIALASGARMSEMAALARDKGFAVFLPSGEVSLSPHPKFLAKNEDPQNRWAPWKIIPLQQDSSLCPVESLCAYLERTVSWCSGSLFKREKGGTLSINGIRQQILYFIKEADPDSVPKAHQVRAIATSTNFFQFMDFEALTKYTGWKSPRVFMRHYFKNIEALKFFAVAAGKVVTPAQNDSEEEEL